nr:ALPV-021 [Albatrosspox virus]
MTAFHINTRSRFLANIIESLMPSLLRTYTIYSIR